MTRRKILNVKTLRIDEQHNNPVQAEIRSPNEFSQMSLNIKQTSLLLSQNVNIDAFDVKPSHQWTSCYDKLGEEGSEIFDILKNLEASLSDERKIALVYIAGYLTKMLINARNMNFHNEKYGKYTNSIDRGKLKVLSDHTYQ